MHHLSRRSVPVVLSFLLLASAVVGASPLVPAQIDAQAKWVAHVDLETILAMPIARECLDKACAKPKTRARHEELAAKLGIHPQHDIRAVTVYATQYEGDFGVALLRVKSLDPAKVVTWFKERKQDHQTGFYMGKPLFSWTKRFRRKPFELTAACAGPDLLVIGHDRDHVKAALDVLAGRRAALDANAPLVKGRDERAMFFCRAVEVPEAYRQSTLCPVLKHCPEATAHWQEQGGRVTGRYEFLTTSPATAELFVQATNGLKALFALRFPDRPTVRKLLDGLSYHADGNRFLATWSGQVEEIRAACEDLKCGAPAPRPHP